MARLTGAHDEAWSRVFSVDRPGHVGVVGPAEVQVEVTVGLQTDATHNEAASNQPGPKAAGLEPRIRNKPVNEG